MSFLLNRNNMIGVASFQNPSTLATAEVRCPESRLFLVCGEKRLLTIVDRCAPVHTVDSDVICIFIFSPFFESCENS